MNMKELSSKVGKSVGNAAAIGCITFVGSVLLDATVGIGRFIMKKYKNYLDA